MFCCDAVFRQGTIFGMTFLYISYVFIFSSKKGSFGPTTLVQRTIFTQDAVNRPMAFRASNWIFFEL